MNNKFYLFLAISIFLFSCQSNNKNTEKKIFLKNYTINGKTIFNNDVNIIYLFSVDSILIAKLNDDNYHYAVYNPKTLKLLGKFARKGNGPNEFPDVLRYEQNIIENNQIKIWVYGYNTNKIYLINVSNSIKNQATTIDTILNVEPQIKFSNLFVTNDYKVIGNIRNTTTDMKRLLIYDIEKNKIVKEVDLFPKINIDNEDIAFIFYKKNMLHNSILVSNKELSKFASVLIRFNRVDIFDANCNTLNFYEGKNNNTKADIKDFLATKLEDRGNIKQYYFYATSSSNYIYTLYYNQLYSEYPKSIPVKIRIFNWNAEPVCEINVPDYLTTFTVDEKNGIMYGVAYFDEKILKYDISSILNEIKTDSK